VPRALEPLRQDLFVSGQGALRQRWFPAGADFPLSVSCATGDTDARM
jgi:hypothetical protein